MCGRICCSLCAPRYEAAASYYDKISGEYKKPIFMKSSVLTFNPSTNISPTEVVPVLVWDREQKCPKIWPMVWGMIPPWTTEDYKSGIYTTHNSQIEKVAESPLYKVPLKKGKRCVILCEGYYEWKTVVGKHKQPCFIYKEQPKGMKAEEEMHWICGEWSKTVGWVGPSLTCMAGLFSEFDSQKHSEPILNATIITMNSSQTLSHVHSRMPAILSTQEQIKNWLNAEDVDMHEAIKNLEASESLQWHEVSAHVNNSKNKISICNQPLDPKKLGGKQTCLTSFFKKLKKDEDDQNES